MRGEGRLVLSAQQGRGGHGEAAEGHTLGINDMPMALDLAGLRAVRRHGRGPLPLGSFTFSLAQCDRGARTATPGHRGDRLAGIASPSATSQ
ncbi:hypothetical protein SDC9_113786 [bioreactor metagenome]|uniref:Uncharacterized protein n=1 Tax=bioreactor metagenome TaxID=1076179 RepID=A0A645BYT7_9ZZZZ